MPTDTLVESLNGLAHWLLENQALDPTWAGERAAEVTLASDMLGSLNAVLLSVRRKVGDMDPDSYGEGNACLISQYRVLKIIDAAMLATPPEPGAGRDGT